MGEGTHLFKLQVWEPIDVNARLLATASDGQKVLFRMQVEAANRAAVETQQKVPLLAKQI